MRGLFIGIGGTGDEILARLKDRVYAACGKEEIPQGLQFRLLDTEDEAYRKDKGARLGDKDVDTAIGSGEYLQLQDDPPGTFIQKTRSIAHKPQDHLEVSGWYRADLFNTNIPEADFNLARGAGQHRQIARMGLFLNKSKVRNTLNNALDLCGRDGGELPIWIVGSVAGGTGAGLFMDIALLARLVSEEKGVQRRILGAAVLPEVFTDVGIDNARAYAALRELERFQAKTPGAYLGRVASKDGVRFSVQYDNSTSVHLENALFDNLVFYNRKCQNEDDRKSYYSQIADGFNLLLDQAAGDQIFREWINAEEGKATSFNTHRVFVPMQLYARQFILDAARAAADGLLPLKADDKDLVDAGSDDDRRAEAAEILSGELFVLYQILAVDSNNKEKRLQELSGQMSASFIIKNMLGFANPTGVFTHPDFPPTEDKQGDAKRLYDDVFAGVQTARDTKENFPNSKARIKAEVKQRRDVYGGDGENSFQKALAAIKPMVIAHIELSIDNSVTDYLGKQSEQALARTLRMLHILQESFNKEIRANLNSIVADDRKKAEGAKGRETDAVSKLDDLSKRLLGWRGALADAQDDYLAAVNAVNQQFQRGRLVEFLRELIEIGVKHAAAWIEGLEKWKTAIQKVREKAENEGNKIDQRLERQTRVDSASMGLKNTKDMEGYFDFLRDKCLCDNSGQSFVKNHLLPGLEWQSGGQPQDIALHKWPEHEGPVNVRDFPDLLERYLSEKIGQRVKAFEGMARYLRWLRDDQGDRPVRLAEEKLQNVTKYFLGDNPASANCKASLLYGDTWGKDDGENEFTNIFNALNGNQSLSSVKDNLTGHQGDTLFKDKNVLAVLMADNAIPYQQIKVFESMRQAYLKVRAEERPTWRAQTYHLFRCDQEAWHIERRQVDDTGEENFPEIKGELARLLDDPKRSELFGRALVCGVIREVSLSKGGKAWVCGEISEENLNKLIMLNDPEDSQDPRDLLRAFVTFVMDKNNRRRNKLGTLDARKIEGWIQDALKKDNPKKTIEQMAKEYRQANAQLFDTASLRNGTDETPVIDNNTFLALVLNHYLAPLL